LPGAVAPDASPLHALLSMKLSAQTRLAVPLLIGMAISIVLLVLSELSHRRLNAANQALSASMQTQALATRYWRW
jgi:cell division protein FtsL